MEKTTDPVQIDFQKKFRLEGKCIVISGACGLIGRAFCEAVAQFGGYIVVVDIPEAKPESLAAELSERHQRKMTGYAAKVQHTNEVKEVLEGVLEEFGKIDGLVCGHQNKSHLRFDPFEKVKEEDWDTVIETNLKGTFVLCQQIGSWMAENGGGSIVNIDSTYNAVAPNQMLYEGTSLGCPVAYSASKGGVNALSRYLASYWAKKKVRVNMITPHGVWNNHEASFEKNFARLSPMGRLSCNHEVAGALIYLLSDASSYVTGDNMMVEGGWTVW